MLSKKQKPVRFSEVAINDSFWSAYQSLIREVVVPYQWEALNDRVPDAEPSFAVSNFKIAAGEAQGEYGGLVFQDSDLAKWIEAAAYTLSLKRDPELENEIDKMVAIIEKAQQKDGYLNTYFTVKEPDKRWTNLFECHELYCAGHIMEAAVAYYEATGKKALLDVMCRFADYIDTVFGHEPGKLKGYDGHEEVELALLKLYRATGNEKYKKLAMFFIDERGQDPYFFDEEWERRGHLSHWSKALCPPPGKNREYGQAHVPVRKQKVAVGHSVRAMYLYTAMADAALENGDKELFDACRELWKSTVERQMYITGGIGSTHGGEAFTMDYDLPAATVYAETCATVGLVFFAQRMLNADVDGQYGDIMETALYNILPAAMSRDGKHFFYVNPLEVWPEASEKNPDRRHVRPVRQKWFGCACCPPNLARLFASLGGYLFATGDKSFYIHLYMGSHTQAMVDGKPVGVKVETRYPVEETVTITLSPREEQAFALFLRIPSWCREPQVTVNGQFYSLTNKVEKGYLRLDRTWQEGDRVELLLPMPVERIIANPLVRDNAGKTSLKRGPVVYCFEEADNGGVLTSLSLPDQSPVETVYDEALLEGMPVLKASGYRTPLAGWDGKLYKSLDGTLPEKEPVELKAVPYYFWGNRKPGEMLVWIKREG